MEKLVEHLMTQYRLPREAAEAYAARLNQDGMIPWYPEDTKASVRTEHPIASAIAEGADALFRPIPSGTPALVRALVTPNKPVTRAQQSQEPYVRAAISRMPGQPMFGEPIYTGPTVSGFDDSAETQRRAQRATYYKEVMRRAATGGKLSPDERDYVERVHRRAWGE